MKSPKKLFAAVLLALAFESSIFAGDVGGPATGPVPAPSPSPAIQSSSASAGPSIANSTTFTEATIFTEAMIDFLLAVLSLY